MAAVSLAAQHYLKEYNTGLKTFYKDNILKKSPCIYYTGAFLYINNKVTDNLAEHATKKNLTKKTLIYLKDR